jgi:hypothetical protein
VRRTATFTGLVYAGFMLLVFFFGVPLNFPGIFCLVATPIVSFIGSRHVWKQNEHLFLARSARA